MERNSRFSTVSTSRGILCPVLLARLPSIHEPERRASHCRAKKKKKERITHNTTQRCTSGQHTFPSGQSDLKIEGNATDSMIPQTMPPYAERDDRKEASFLDPVFPRYGITMMISGVDPD